MKFSITRYCIIRLLSSYYLHTLQVRIALKLEKEIYNIWKETNGNKGKDNFKKLNTFTNYKKYLN